MPPGRSLMFSLIALWILPIPLWADDDDEDFPPGMLARYSAGGRSVERIDPDVEFVWGTASADPRLPAGRFEASWTSLLLIRQQTRYTFHAYVEGEVIVEVDGRQVLTGRRERPGWVSGEAVPLSFGEKPLRVTFRKVGKRASLRLFWSSDAFWLEPLPAHLLFRESGSQTLSSIERGRLAYDAHRCNRCHRREHESLSPAAPALTHIHGGLNPQWLVAQIQNPAEISSHARMPSFDFTAEEARAVAAFLLKNAKQTKLERTPKAKAPKKGPKPTPKSERRAGQVLLRSVGCLACHTLGKYGNSGPYSGGDLSALGRKRSRDWLYTWLGRPAKLNPDHRMPVFKLTLSERRRLAVYLADLGSERTTPTASPIPSDDKAIAKGRKLVEAARCAACHRIEGIEPSFAGRLRGGLSRKLKTTSVRLGSRFLQQQAHSSFAGIADLSKPIGDWSKSCLEEKADRGKQRPAYKHLDRQAVIAYVNSRVGRLSPESRFARGHRVLIRRNCLSCHQRDLSKGIVSIAGVISRVDKDLAGQSQVMIPPALTAVGDKLLDASLAEAVSGEQKQPRMPWLRIRMPRFNHSEQDKADLLAYTKGHDRIPDGAPHSAPAADDLGPTDSQTLVAGHQLVGANGFSCIACHQIGTYTPRNVALGTRGSDLLMLGKRMRKSYYTRWTRSPLRIVPGMEMPSYTKPLPDVLEGRIDRQLAATWQVLNDPRFKAPTDPASVEQFFIVKPGEPARIVRDVFMNPEENGGGAIARALAIGMNNGHNLLFDLDRFALKQWTFGDLARQRTFGKSWYWDMAGVAIITGFGKGSDFALRSPRNRSKKLWLPKTEHGTNGRLISYRRDGFGVRMEYEIAFETDGARNMFRVTETIMPTAHNSTESAGGWERDISIRAVAVVPGSDERRVVAVPKQLDLLISRPTSKTTFGSPKIECIDNKAAKWETFDGLPGREFTTVSTNTSARGRGATVRRIRLRYECALRPEKLALKPPEPKDPPPIQKINSVPGYDGVRLPLDSSIMPTAITWTSKGRLAFTSLKGDVYLVDDTDGDGIEETLTLFEEGLAAPYGIIADGDDLIVAHKPELLRLRDTDGDGRADQRIVVATGWGYNDNYHDWTCGIVRDSADNLYVGLGSDYAQSSRPLWQARWRGKVLLIDPQGRITPIGHSFRYPTGLAINADDDVFVSDNQGVQNCFNEINHLVMGQQYGVLSRTDQQLDSASRGPVTPPAIQVPHPWTRSVNGLFFLPDLQHNPSLSGRVDSRQHRAGTEDPLRAFAGHGIGCEYNGRFLIRFTVEKVRDKMQGATYYFSRPDAGTGSANFLGPLCGATAANGDIYVGSIHDSGWLGGGNTGEIVRLRSNGKQPNGIRELRATPDGFEISFIKPVDAKAAVATGNYTISGYTRVYKGGYATPDSGRHKALVKSVRLSADAKRVNLQVDGLRTAYVYEVSCGNVGIDPKTELFPATGHYTLHRIPHKR